MTPNSDVSFDSTWYLVLISTMLSVARDLLFLISWFAASLKRWLSFKSLKSVKLFLVNFYTMWFFVLGSFWQTKVQSISLNCSSDITEKTLDTLLRNIYPRSCIFAGLNRFPVDYELGQCGKKLRLQSVSDGSVAFWSIWITFYLRFPKSEFDIIEWSPLPDLATSTTS